MTKQQIEQWIISTDERIENYEEFLAGKGNWDEFEDELPYQYADGFAEDSKKLAEKLLEILKRRKVWLQSQSQLGGAENDRT